MWPLCAARQLILSGGEEIQHYDLRVLHPQTMAAFVAFISDLLDPELDDMLTGSASRVTNGILLTPPVSRLVSTCSRVV